MASNSKSSVHVYRHQNMSRQHMVSVPIVKVSPEIASAIRRREGTAGVEYWNHLAANGIHQRPVRRMTVEEAFPRLHMNGYYDKSKKAIKPNGTLTKSHGDNYRIVPIEPKKATATDCDAMQPRENYKDLPSDMFRNYPSYNAKVRYVDNRIPGKHLGTRQEIRSKKSKKKDANTEDYSKQNGHTIQQVGHTTAINQNDSAHTNSQSNGHAGGLPSYHVVPQGKDDKPSRRTAWSEMTPLAVNGPVVKVSQPTFEKLGMNHTFRIPRPKATVSSRNSVPHSNINLTVSKKRAVSFGQDKVYEYTPLEPLNNYPIHEELL